MQLNQRHKQRLLREVFDGLNENTSMDLGDTLVNFEQGIIKLEETAKELKAMGDSAASRIIKNHINALNSLFNEISDKMAEDEFADIDESRASSMSKEEIFDIVEMYLDASGMDNSDINAMGTADDVVKMMVEDGELPARDEGVWISARMAVEDWMGA